MEKDNLEILLEDIRGKFDLVLEGHDVLRKEIKDTREDLCEKINVVDFKVGVLNQKIDDVRDGLNQKIDDVHDGLNQKIDDVRDGLCKKIDDIAADLAAHRRDTEAHPPLYKVKEGGLHPRSWTKCVRVVGRIAHPGFREKGSCHEATKKIQHRAQTSGC